MLVGYARVSTLDQNPQLQIDALEKAGCTKIFIDKASGVDRNRPQLARALAYNNPGDVLVVWKIDRLARSLPDLLEIIRKLESRKVAFKSLTEPIDTSSPAGVLTLQIIGACAQFERSIIKQRTKAGMAAAKARGVKSGREEKFTAAKVAEARAKRAMGLTHKEVYQAIGISSATYYKGLSRYSNAQHTE